MTTLQPTRHVAPSLLEELGKTAARLSETSGLSLTEAAVQTLGREKLSAEQVRRVVEFCNIDAVNRKYAAATGMDRIVSLEGGPADPLEVIARLKAASAPQDMRIEALEYSVAPQYEKRAQAMPAVTAPNLVELHNKLSSAHEELVERCEGSHFTMAEAFEELKTAARSASFGGASLSELFAAWQAHNEPLAKVAAAELRPSIPWGTKMAGRRVSAEHPVVRSFIGFAKAASQYSTEVRARQEVEVQLSRVAAHLRGSLS